MHKESGHVDRNIAQYCSTISIYMVSNYNHEHKGDADKVSGCMSSFSCFRCSRCKAQV